jgi:tRNA modification GTPase
MKGEVDTIFALATAPGRAGVAVVRVSGPSAGDAVRRLTRAELPAERKAVLRPLFDLSTNGRIDAGLVLWFPGPHSYTGENVVEFQVHGGRAVQTVLIANLAGLPGLRPAEPGEFTRRAVQNGCIDLTQAEAIADLVDAETEIQRRQALRQYEGGLSRLYEDWRARLIRAAAWLEAGIDFADEDIPAEAMQDSRAQLAELSREIGTHLADGRRGEILRDGLHVAVIGPPNAGKSSLVNALARAEVAIVSAIPGTTRDVIEVRLDLAGYPVILADTAGLREAGDAIEQEGVRRAHARARSADLRLLVLDGSTSADVALPTGMPEAEIIVWNKADLTQTRSATGVCVSAKTGEGLPELIQALASHADKRLGRGESPIITRTRHRKALETAIGALETALKTEKPELAAEHLRIALTAIGRITGRVDLDELLDVVFADFCIGK